MRGDQQLREHILPRHDQLSTSWRTSACTAIGGTKLARDKTGCHTGPCPIVSLADPVPWVVDHATVLHEAVDHAMEGRVLVAMGHLANVRTGRDSRFALIRYALVAAC